MGFLPDQPSPSDQLRFRRYLDSFRRLLFHPTTKTPLTVGVYGDWGTGKSSLLQQIHNSLMSEPDAGFIPIRFSPWGYQHEPNLLVPLLSTLAAETDVNVYGQIKKIAAIVSWHLTRKLVLPAVNVFTRGLTDEKEVRESGEAVEKDLDAEAPKLTLSDRVKLRELIQKLVQDIQKQKSQKGQPATLVFLIDEIDRCHPPERIVAMLEEIKVFLDFEGCVFVISCDSRIVIEAIEGKFPGQGAAYLEKFIQIPFPIPRTHPQSLREMLDELLRAAGEDPDPEWLAYWEHIAAVLDFNPRRLKRLYNEWLLGWDILSNQSHARGADPYLLAKWLILRQVSSRLAARPELYLELDAAMRQDGGLVISEQALTDKFGLNRKTVQFLNYDISRCFGSLESFSLHCQLSATGLLVTRHSVEEMLLRDEPLPDDLSGLDLSYANLVGADFSGRNLQGVDFRCSNLDHANFKRADVGMADFTGSRFTRISIRGAKGIDTLIDSPEAARLRELFSYTLPQQ